MAARLGATIVAVSILAALTGCAPAGSTGTSARLTVSTGAVAEARSALYDLLDSTQAVAGGTWVTRDDPTARECLIPFQSSGERYPALRIGSAPESISRAADAVASAWRSRGFTVETVRIGAVTQVQATSPRNEVLLFRASVAAMTLQGESECRPVA